MTNKKNRAIIKLYELGYSVTNGFIVNPSGKELKRQIDRNGYYSVTVKIDGVATKCMIHRFVAFCKFGNKIFQPNIVVRHLDGNSKNNEHGNIDIGSQSQNCLDRKKSDRIKHAKKAATKIRKLSHDEAEQLRLDRKNGLTYSELVIKYNIAKSTVSYIVNKKTYM